MGTLKECLWNVKGMQKERQKKQKKKMCLAMRSLLRLILSGTVSDSELLQPLLLNVVIVSGQHDHRRPKLTLQGKGVL